MTRSGDSAPANVHGRQMTRSSSLEDNTNNTNSTGAPNEDGPPTPAVRSGRREQGTEEAPGLQDAHNVCAKVCPFDVASVFVRELV